MLPDLLTVKVTRSKPVVRTPVPVLGRVPTPDDLIDTAPTGFEAGQLCASPYHQGLTDRRFTNTRERSPSRGSGVISLVCCASETSGNGHRVLQAFYQV